MREDTILAQITHTAPDPAESLRESMNIGKNNHALKERTEFVANGSQKSETSAARRVGALSVERAAALIGVSSATLRNWVKAGHLVPISDAPLLFSEKDLSDLKDALNSGRLGRLRKRANKSISKTITIPMEHVTDDIVLDTVNRICEVVHSEHLDIGTTMYVVALRLIELSAEAIHTSLNDSLDFESFQSWSRECIRTELSNWKQHVLSDVSHSGYSAVYRAISITGGDDFLGLLYQSLSSEGNRSTKGSYYTPSQLVMEALTQASFCGGAFLDPCCGTGNFLVGAAKWLRLEPHDIYGYDLDPIAVRIARINLLLVFPTREFTPNIGCLNSLSELATGELFCETNYLSGHFDLIATNPPWGAYKNSQAPQQSLNGIKSQEVFSHFLAKSMDLLKEGGHLSFILPDSILKIRTHSDIRELLLNKASITRIVKLGRQFAGVFTTAIRMDLVMMKAPDDWLVSISDQDACYEVPQQRFSLNNHNAFDVGTTTSEERFLSKLYSVEHETLEGNSDWALGIVTGDNGRFVSPMLERGMEAVFRGSDIDQYRINSPKAFIRFAPNEFQQVAKLELYRAPEKLIYRFISNKLTFAYDDEQRLTLNSANILVPHIPGLSIRVVLAFLNSNTFQYIFRKKFSTHKILRGDLERLPFPIIGPEMAARIETFTFELNLTEARRAELESLIYSCFELTTFEIDEIERIRKER